MSYFEIVLFKNIFKDMISIIKYILNVRNFKYCATYRRKSFKQAN